MNSLVLRPATLEDAADLSAFAARVFDETFGPDNRREDMESYLSAHYTAAIQEREIVAPATEILLAETDGELVGYAHLCHAAEATPAVEIRRFYVDRRHHGQGSADRMMAEVLARAERRGAPAWLCVWERNARAIRFYEDKGLPALKDWLGRALRNPITFSERLIPDERERISASASGAGSPACQRPQQAA